MTMEWADRANCRGTETNDWYPDDAYANIPNKPTLKRICDNCEVNAECLEWAVKHESHGYFAGTTASDRQLIRRKRGITVKDPMYW